MKGIFFAEPGDRAPDSWSIIQQQRHVDSYYIYSYIGDLWLCSTAVVHVLKGEFVYAVKTSSGSRYILNSDLEFNLSRKLLDQFGAEQSSMTELLKKEWGNG